MLNKLLHYKYNIKFVSNQTNSTGIKQVTCIKSKVGLLQTANSWANAGVLFGARVGRRVAFGTIKLIHAKVLCTIFDINYHPNIAHINIQGASILVLT